MRAARRSPHLFFGTTSANEFVTAQGKVILQRLIEVQRELCPRAVAPETDYD
jgi:hypothetical protein